MLVQMLPRSSTGNIENRALRNAELFRERRVLVSALLHQSNGPNIGFGELRPRCLRSTEIVVSALVDHIAHVVAFGSKKEVVRINTSPVVAPVQNTESVRDVPVMKFIAKTMGQKRSIGLESNHPVARGRADGGLPFPGAGTPVGEIDLFDEFENEGSVMDNSHVDLLDRLTAPRAVTSSAGAFPTPNYNRKPHRQGKSTATLRSKRKAVLP